ncbi:hypothetical protein C8Q77DRAFT_1074137 [Trametes polyzona]|nr:hypothetical protein C8Q77DRAFT_1074137 [Trametes polyzona]
MPIATEVSPRGHQQHDALRPIVTQDIQRGSPAPRAAFEVEKPRGRSLSPVHSRVAAHTPSITHPAVPVASSSSGTIGIYPTPAPEPAFVPSPAPAPALSENYVPPPLTWRTAAQDAKAGIYYTKDEFPTSSFLPPPFSREPVQVQAGERVQLLEEIDDYAVRVRVLRTGKTGLIPAWNTEGALERLTRINTAFNEAATCPVEARALRRRFSESAAMSSSSDDAYHTSPSSSDPSLSHAHSRCIPFATRVRFGEYYSNPSADDDSSSSSDSDDSDSPVSPPAQDAGRGRSLVHSEPGVYRAQPGTLEKGGLSAASARSVSGARKSVVFPPEERPQVVFRYPSEDLVETFHEEKREGSVEDGEEGKDEEWWWHGWEEPLEELEAEAQQEQEEEERGRARDVKMAAGQDGEAAMRGAGSDGLSRWLVSIQEEDH